MNKIFSEYTTSTAFMLQLSKLQCNAILRLVDSKPIKAKDKSGIFNHITFPYHNVGTYKSLTARGLVFWHTDGMGNPHGFGGLTDAGKLVAKLLIEAGLTIELTNTVSVLKKLKIKSPHNADETSRTNEQN